MYKIVKDKCQSGFAYVIDYQGNKCYYGRVKECEDFIFNMIKIFRAGV